MNLIAFPHYTCGGLLCDIFNNMFSEQASNGGLNNPYHGIGKISDADTVLLDYNVELFNDRIKKFADTDIYIGTHCWPGLLNLNQFSQTINITTMTFRSRAYRWIRAYHHYYVKSQPWLTASGIQRIDKERETAKNYLISFPTVDNPHCHNIEFSEIVDNTAEFQSLVKNYNFIPHYDRWTKLNDFLYKSDIWNSCAIQRLHEAESEISLKKYYVY